MTGPVPYGEGFIIIRPDFSRFDDELRRGVNRLLDDLADDFRDFERFVSEVFEDLADEIIFHMRYVDRTLNRIFNQIARDARECGFVIASSFTLASRIAQEELDDLEDRAQRAFRNIRQASRGSAGSIFNIFSGLGTRLMSLFGNLFSSGSGGAGAGAGAGANVGGALMSSLSGIGGQIGGILQIAAMAAIIPIVIQVVGVLINLAGALFALPAAASVALAAFIPLTIAFKGFGEALAAVWSGDPEKIAEATKNLAPHARAVLREFAPLVPVLKEIGKSVQQGFFIMLDGVVTKLAKNTLPALSAGLFEIGKAWGTVFRAMLDVFTTSEFATALQAVLASTQRIILAFAPVAGRFMSAVVGLIIKGLPYVERFAYWIFSLVDGFSQWIAKSTESGKVTGWLDQAWEAGKKLYAVVKELGIFVGLMFGSFGDEGQDTLGGMAEQIAKVNEYLRSADGQEALHNLGVIIHWVGNAVVWLMGTVTGAYDALNLLFNFIRAIGPFVSGLVSQWVQGWKDFGNSAKEAWENIKRWVMMGWNAIVAFLVLNWVSLKKIFTDGWNSLKNTATSWYTNTKNAIMGFPGALKTFLVDAVHNAAYNVGYAIGTMIKRWLEFPGQVVGAFQTVWQGVVTAVTAIGNFFTETIPAMAQKVGTWFLEMWNTAYNATANFVSNAITKAGELPGRIGDFISQTRDRVVNRFTELKNTAVERVRGLVTGAREEAGKLPGQVENAIRGVISKTFDIGRDMIYGMINGIKSAAKALWNAARGVVMDAWQGAKDALQSKSPSKKWAELGMDSAAGYQVGFDKYDLTESIASSIKMPLDAFNRRATQAPTVNSSVSVGGAQVVAYLQIGDDQLRPVVVTTLKEHPQEVALAAQQGDTQLARRGGNR